MEGERLLVATRRSCEMALVASEAAVGVPRWRCRALRRLYAGQGLDVCFQCAAHVMAAVRIRAGVAQQVRQAETVAPAGTARSPRLQERAATAAPKVSALTALALQDETAELQRALAARPTQTGREIRSRTPAEVRTADSRMFAGSARAALGTIFVMESNRFCVEHVFDRASEGASRSARAWEVDGGASAPAGARRISIGGQVLDRLAAAAQAADGKLAGNGVQGRDRANAGMGGPPGDTEAQRAQRGERFAAGVEATSQQRATRMPHTGGHVVQNAADATAAFAARKAATATPVQRAQLEAALARARARESRRPIEVTVGLVGDQLGWRREADGLTIRYAADGRVEVRVDRRSGMGNDVGWQLMRCGACARTTRAPKRTPGSDDARLRAATATKCANDIWIGCCDQPSRRRGAYWQHSGQGRPGGRPAGVIYSPH